jgi:hypothetical protein
MRERRVSATPVSREKERRCAQMATQTAISGVERNRLEGKIAIVTGGRK